jgi:hypothetical protein
MAQKHVVEAYLPVVPVDSYHENISHASAPRLLEIIEIITI